MYETTPGVSGFPIKDAYRTHSVRGSCCGVAENGLGRR